MKNFILVLNLFSITLLANAQQTIQRVYAPDAGFTNLFQAVEYTSDAGYIFTGVSDGSGNGNSDIWIVRTDSLGDTLWMKFLASGLENEAYDILQSADGGYVVCGFADIGGGNRDHYVHKLNASGATEWGKNYGNDFSNQQANGIVQTVDGGYAFAGTDGNHGALVKLNSVGDTLWTKQYQTIGLSAFSHLR